MDRWNWKDCYDKDAEELWRWTRLVDDMNTFLHIFEACSKRFCKGMK